MTKAPEKHMTENQMKATDEKEPSEAKEKQQAYIAANEHAYPATDDDMKRWAEEGSYVLEQLLGESHAPEEVRTLRPFSIMELTDSEESLLGPEHARTLRNWVKAQGIKVGRGGSEARIKLTLSQVKDYMAERGILPERPKGSKPARIMVGAYKGGSGKSAMTLHLAHYFGLKMYRVLVIDMDPQATVTKGFGLTPESIDYDATVLGVFESTREGQKRPPLPYQDTHFPTIKITPANLSVMQADMFLAAALRDGVGQDFYRAMDDAISQIEDQFDIILFDTAPAFSITSIATVYAANGLILPMPAEIPDFAAAFDFCQMVGDMLSALQPIEGQKKVWDPVLLVHSKVKKTRTADHVRKLAGMVFAGHQVQEMIPDTAAVSNSFGEFKSVFEVTSTTVDSGSLNRARDAYSALGSRVLRILNASWEAQSQNAHQETGDVER